MNKERISGYYLWLAIYEKALLLENGLSSLIHIYLKRNILEGRELGFAQVRIIWIYEV